MISEVDFKLYINKIQGKSFTFRNSDSTYYDMTGSTVKLLYYKTPTPVEITATLDISTGTTHFTFSAADTDTAGYSEYLVQEVRGNGDYVILTRGNITVEEYVPFSNDIEAWLQAEIPVGMVLDNHFVSQKIKYWQIFLQDGQGIPDASVHNESAWPAKLNILIAKLVAYDALVGAVKGNLLLVFGSSVASESTSTGSNAGGVKSIETGPTKVEFHPAGDTMKEVIKSSNSTTGANGTLQVIAEDVCGFANHLGIKLPMCKALKTVIALENLKPTFSTSLPIESCNNNIPSQG